MGWEEAFEEECELSQSTDRAIADALDSRSDSGSETRACCSSANSACASAAASGSACDESSVYAAAPKGLALWWMQKLVKAARDIECTPLQHATRARKLIVISGCTGCSAESAVLQAGAPLLVRHVLKSVDCWPR